MCPFFALLSFSFDVFCVRPFFVFGLLRLALAATGLSVAKMSLETRNNTKEEHREGLALKSAKLVVFRFAFTAFPFHYRDAALSFPLKV